jgi:ATP-dependent DNA helicase RecG
VALLTGSHPAPRAASSGELAGGIVHLVVGTHALVRGPRGLSRAGLVDHRRAAPVRRGAARHAAAKGLHPDVLVMTATPIPRTLALTTYGDLDVSTMRDLPPGRTPIRTTASPRSRRDEVYASSAADRGPAGLRVYPLVEESEKVDLRPPPRWPITSRRTSFPSLPGGAAARPHEAGREGPRHAGVRRGRVDVLVSTTVVEVGVDVPNATVMVVEHAERFGLSQLHQLRGRVGRGAHAVLLRAAVPAPLSDDARERLEGADRPTHRRLRDRRAGPGRPLRGPGRLLRHAPVGHATLRVRRPAARPPALEALGEVAEAFDIVFVDPPYEAADIGLIVEAAAACVAEGGRLVVEHSRRRPVAASAGRLVRVREVRCGDTMLTFYAAAGP